jgi:hypothetical protein
MLALGSIIATAAAQVVIPVAAFALSFFIFSQKKLSYTGQII